MTSREQLLQEVRERLRQRVGGFFGNTRRDHGMACGICCGPTSDGICSVCRVARNEFGQLLADQTVILTYARGYAPFVHQSVHTVKGYKRNPPATKSVDDLKLMVLGATVLHGSCLAVTAGEPWGAITFVPSENFPEGTHPLAQLARAAVGANTPDNRLTLALGPGIGLGGRSVRADRFSVPPEYCDRVRGRHVLLVEDTWTTGSKAQSAAIALKAAGARYVTVLCLARWCRHDWSDHRALLDSCTDPYDAFACPVTGGACPPGCGPGTLGIL